MDLLFLILEMVGAPKNKEEIYILEIPFFMVGIDPQGNAAVTVRGPPYLVRRLLSREGGASG